MNARLLAPAVFAVSSVLVACSGSSDGSSPSSTEANESAATALSLGDVAACGVLTNDEVAAIVDSEVIGNSPSPGGDDACTYAYGDSTTVAPPDGEHLTVTIRRSEAVEGAAPITGLDLDGAWDEAEASLALQFGGATLTIAFPDGGSRTEAEALAKHAVERIRTPAPNPATSTSVDAPARSQGVQPVN